MGDTPTTGSVKVVLKLDTAEAKAKADEVERKLRNNERQRRFVVERVNKDGFGAKTGSSNMGQTIADKMLEKVLPRPGGYNPFNSIGQIPKMVAAFRNSLAGRPTPQAVANGQAGVAAQVGNALGKVGNFVNPFPTGGVSGSNLNGGQGSTLALAGTLYGALQKGSQFAGLGLAYAMKSGQASVKTSAGEFFNELNSTFSYINNYAASFRDAGTRLSDWDDAVAAVTGKLPDTQFYLPKFQRQAHFERQFADMMARNMALTRAGARGNSSLADQLGDAAARAMSR